MNNVKKTSTIFETIIEYLFLLVLGGSIYYGIEMMWRGRSHPAMILVGGLCFVCIGLINEIFPWTMSIWKQMLIGDAIVLFIEFISGCILNLWLGLAIWDYSNEPFNLLGQICLLFAVIWLPLILIAIILDDWVKYLLGKGEKPHYNFKWGDPPTLQE